MRLSGLSLVRSSFNLDCQDRLSIFSSLYTKKEMTSLMEYICGERFNGVWFLKELCVIFTACNFFYLVSMELQDSRLFSLVCCMLLCLTLLNKIISGPSLPRRLG